MSEYIPPALITLVRERAGDICEYCHLPQTKELVPLFHPRRDRWSDHFRWAGARLVGQTPSGRATILALGMNRAGAAVIAIRKVLIRLGRPLLD